MGRETDKPRVLVVDDVAENLHILMDLLSGLYSVTPARSGTSALRKAVLDPQPDLILLDIMMPEMNGFEVCERLKAQEVTRDIPVIFLTAVTDQVSEVKGLALGGVDYIRKPFSPPTTKARVASHLELSRSRRILAERNAILEERNAALEENGRLRDDIQRITQHDLKAPLHLLLNFPEMMLEEPNINPKQKEWLQRMVRAGRNMLEMINCSLDLYKMETGSYDYQPDLQDIIAVARQVASDQEQLAFQHGVDLQVEMVGDQGRDEKGFNIHIDRMLTYSMLANLYKNAIESSPYGSKVSVTFQKVKDEVVIEVHNQGMVPEGIQSCFFDKYVTSGKSGGTGLGTYSARLMASTQKGAMAMQTDPKQGTTIQVRLPILTNPLK